MNLKVVQNNDSPTVDSMALQPGFNLLSGQYNITSLLRAGGFGITYLATDSLKRTVVIKECFVASMCERDGSNIVANSRAKTKAFNKIVELFMQEAQNQADVDHPNIARVHQVFRDNNTAYIALDYIDGEDLFDKMDQAGALPPRDVKHWLSKILLAVGFIHRKGILHRDIAPDNILIDSHNEPFIIDFGAARERASEEGQNAMVVRAVKDGYSPPEFYEKNSEQYLSSDIYSLAATFYYLISGVAPKASVKRLESLKNTQTDEYEPLAGRFDDYPASLLASIDKAMSLDPNNRYQTAEEWLADMDEGTPAVKAAAATTSAKQSGGSHKKKRSMLPLVGLVAICGIGGYLAYDADTRAKLLGSAGSTENAETVASVEPPRDAPIVLDGTSTSTSGTATAVEETPTVIEVEEPAVQPTETATAIAPERVTERVGQLVAPLPFTAAPSRQNEGTFAQVGLIRPGLPEATQEWLQSGTIIYSVEGNLVTNQDAIAQQVSNLAADSDGQPITVSMRVKPFGQGDIVERTLEIPVGYQIALDNGLQFVSTAADDGHWVTTVAEIPENTGTSLQVGDVILSEAQTGHVFKDQGSILEVVSSLSNTGNRTAFFTVSRKGRLDSAEAPVQ